MSRETNVFRIALDEPCAALHVFTHEHAEHLVWPVASSRVTWSRIRRSGPWWSLKVRWRSSHKALEALDEPLLRGGFLPASQPGLDQRVALLVAARVLVGPLPPILSR